MRGAFDGTKAIEISEGETKIYWIDALAGKILMAIELQSLYEPLLKRFNDCYCVDRGRESTHEWTWRS